MPIPASFQRASVEFEKFMLDARDIAGLATTNMAYNMVVGVLHTFRRRLSVQEAIGFANVLPAVLAAIFVSDWDPSEAKAEFTDRTAMTQEVKSLRAEHNFSPDTAIHDVATALRRNVIQPEFDHYLASLSAVAQDYWRVDRTPPAIQSVTPLYPLTPTDLQAASANTSAMSDGLALTRPPSQARQ